MRVKKNPEIPDGRGSSQNPSGMEILKGWRVKMKKPSLEGYRYFLELHIKKFQVYKISLKLCF